MRNQLAFFRDLSRSWSALAAFGRDRSGAVAISMALMVIVVVAFVGAAVDVARWHSARNRAQLALDNALLAAARSYQTNGGNKSAALLTAQRTYASVMKRAQRLTSHNVKFVFSSDGKSVLATGTAKLDTPFLRILDIPELTVLSLSTANAPSATIGKSQMDLEVSMVLDITGSMAGYRLDSLKQAAKDLVDLLISDAPGSQTSKIALIPYAAAVNAGALANYVRGNVGKGRCTSPGCEEFRFTSATGQTRTLEVSNCVSERTGPFAFDDSTPSTKMLGFAYLPPTNPCPTPVVVPLIRDKSVLKGAIDRLSAGGSTGAQIGFAWGWYTLSPKWGYLWPSSAPANYNDSKIKKIAVLMTDGEFNSPYCNGVISSDATTGSGSTSDHINCKSPNGSSYAQALKLCGGMKAAGIEVYTVGFDVIDNGNAKQVMAECASDATHAYNAKDGEQLKQVFRDIGLKINPVFLAR